MDSAIPCTKITVDVQHALATATPKPTKVPTPYGFNNGGGFNSGSNFNPSPNNGNNNPS